jgi:hypothetical protein
MRRLFNAIEVSDGRFAATAALQAALPVAI